jgi:hypothetical protein
MRFRDILTISALFLGAMTLQGAVAQELSVDANSLDTSSVGAKAPGKKAAAKTGASGQGAKSEGKTGKTPDRQFGELEGWSPGKAPPAEKKEETRGRFSNSKAPVNVTPSGGMAVGLPF